MLSNLDRYKSDLDSLVAKGEGLYLTMLRECLPAQFDDMVNKSNEEVKDFLNTLPSFRLADFVRHYEKPKIRKELTYENYRIEDCLQGLNVTRGWEKEKVVGPDAAIPHLRQQLAIVKSVKTRFESSLFDIRQLVQADLFDSELDAAGELAKHKYTRAAGALAGVVLERHLAQVCSNRSVKLAKKQPTIADLNEALKKDNLVNVLQWRFIQHLADIRNLCDHAKQTEPTREQVNELIAGVKKITKTIF